jgi:hypothetical protein
VFFDKNRNFEEKKGRSRKNFGRKIRNFLGKNRKFPEKSRKFLGQKIRKSIGIKTEIFERREERRNTEIFEQGIDV